jgi:serine/threonine protein kinase
MSMVSPEEFLTLLERSRLLTPSQFAAARQFVDRPGRPAAVKVAQWLVNRGDLTVWQAERLLAGCSEFFLGNYKFLAPIGEGAMGVVFRAEHAVMGRTVAVKVLSKARLSHPNALARFQREVQALAALDHPNIVHAYDAGQAAGTHFLVMEYIEGRDLNAWIEKYGRIEIPWACEFIRQAALGAAYAHQRGMVHRDIKPANILIAWKEGQARPVAKLLDLGLALVFTDGELEAPGGSHDTSFRLADTQAAQLTQADTILGTPDYLAPEQVLRDRELDARTDVFALGCTLFKLLTGNLPYDGPDLFTKLQARVSPSAPPPVRLRALLPEAPAELEAVVAKMLERFPEQRYQTAREVAEELAAFAPPPDAHWQRLGPPPIVHRDSAEVGSSQMVLEPRLKGFLEELSSELPASLPKITDAGVLEPEAMRLPPEFSAAAEPKARFIRPGEVGPRRRRSVLALVRRWWKTAAWLVVAALVAWLAFRAWPYLQSRADPPSWPGRTSGIAFLWAGGGSQPAGADDAAAPFQVRALEQRGAVALASDGSLDLTGGGAFLAPLEVNYRILQACRSSHQLSLECILSPTVARQAGPARIVTYSSSRKSRNFLLAQDGDEFVFNLRTSATGESGARRPIALCKARTGRFDHLIVSYAPGRLTCFANGVQAMSSLELTGDLSNWTPQHLLFGQEWDGKADSGAGQWNGRLRAVVVRSRSIEPLEALELFRLAQARWGLDFHDPIR